MGSPPYSVFVGNVPYDATEERLRDIFSEVGPVHAFRCASSLPYACLSPPYDSSRDFRSDLVAASKNLRRFCFSRVAFAASPLVEELLDPTATSSICRPLRYMTVRCTPPIKPRKRDPIPPHSRVASDGAPVRPILSPTFPPHDHLPPAGW